MKGLRTLVMMQLKDKIDLSFVSSWKKALFKTILFILKFLLITGIIYVCMYFLSLLRLLSILPGIPQNFMVIVFTFMLTLSLLVCTVGLSKSLYFARDNQFLLTMPANRTVVFSSKIIVYYIYELIRNVTYFLPVFIAYGMINSAPIYYYFWILIGVGILTAVPVVLGALLSIPMMFIMSFLKQNKWLAYSLLVLLAAGIVALVIFIVYKIPAHFDILATWGTTFWEIQDFVGWFNRVFAPFAWLLTLVAGTRYGISNILFNAKHFIIIFSTIGAVLVVYALTYFIVRPLYFKMTSSPFEYKRVKVQAKKNEQSKPAMSILKKEILLLFRTPTKMFSLLAVAIFLPIAIFLLNKVFGAMDASSLGESLEITFNTLVILLTMTATNAGIAHIYSEEGSSAYLIRTNPQSHLKQLSMKLVINGVVMTLSLVATTVILAQFMKMKAFIAIMYFAFAEMLYLAHLLWSAEMDFMNPQNGQYQTTGQHVNNPNELKSTIFSFLLSGVFAILTFFFVGEGIYMVFVKLSIFTLLFLAIRVWLFINKIKVYYKEMG